MRVITGELKGRLIATLKGDSVRPTSDKVKEAIFSSIQFMVPGSSFLDLFAGSGQMGIEALSRGAARAVFVDSSRQAVAVIHQNLKGTFGEDRATVLNRDVTSFVRSCIDSFDIVFLDPPYKKDILQLILPEVVKIMNPAGVIVCESAIDDDIPRQVGGFTVYGSHRYGKIKTTSFRASL